MTRSTTKGAAARRSQPKAALSAMGKAHVEARRSGKGDPGQPRTGWTVGGGPRMWPRQLPKSTRTMALYGQVPLAVGISNDLQHIVRAVRWFTTVDSPTTTRKTACFRAALEVASRDLWRVADDLKRRTDFMAELVPMTDDRPTSVEAAMQQLGVRLVAMA